MIVAIPVKLPWRPRLKSIIIKPKQIYFVNSVDFTSNELNIISKYIAVINMLNISSEISVMVMKQDLAQNQNPDGKDPWIDMD